LVTVLMFVVFMVRCLKVVQFFVQVIAEFFSYRYCYSNLLSAKVIY